MYDARCHCIQLLVDDFTASGIRFVLDGVELPGSFSISGSPSYSFVADMVYVLGGKLTNNTLSQALVGHLDLFTVGTCTDNALACQQGTPNQFFIFPEFTFTSCDAMATIFGETIGGVPPISYTLDGGTVVSQLYFENINNGLHTIQATDATGATRWVDVLVEPGKLIVDGIGVFDAGCSGNMGAFDIDLCGYEPFTYYLDGVEVSGPYISGLVPGTYFLEIEDIAGHHFDSTLVVEYEPKVVGVNVKHLNCEGSLDGRIQVTLSCEDPDVQYQLDNGPLQSFNIFSNLEAGTYELKVWNGYNQMFYSEVLEVLEGDPVSIEDYTFLNSTCAGIDNGAIEFLSPVSGTLLYSINGGTNFSSQTSFTDLEAGTYSLVILDPVGCVSEPVEVVLENQQEVIITETELIKQPTCAPNKDGVVRVAAQGGFGGYLYGFNPVGYFENDTLKGLPGDAFVEIFVRDHLGCTSDIEVLQLDYLGKLQLNIEDLLDASCSDESDGEVRITSPGGTQGMEINLVNEALGFRPGPFYRQDLSADHYEVLIRDAAGCTSDTATFTITNTGKLRDPFVLVKPTNCNPPIDIFGGVAAFPDSVVGSTYYEYSFNSGTFREENDTLGLSLGDVITVQIKRPENLTLGFDECLSDPVTVTVTEAIPLDTVSTSFDPETCYLFYDGTLEVEVIGGGGNYTYSLDGGPEQSSPIFSGISTSLNWIKTLRVYTDDVCGLTQERVYKDFILDLGATRPLTMVLYDIEPITCQDYSDGIIKMVIEGGSPTFEFTIDGGATWNTQDIRTGLPAGPYNLQARDGRGCFTPIYSTALLNPEPLRISDIVTEPIACFGEATGSIDIIGLGGSEEYSYSIDGGVSYQLHNRKFTELTAGTYEVIFKDLEGCGEETQTVILNQNDELLLNANATAPVSCVPANDGSIELFPRGGATPYVFEDGNQATFDEVMIENLEPGTYRYQLQDIHGCTSEWIEVVLPEPYGPIIEDTEVIDALCYGQNNGRILLTGHDDYQYSIDQGQSWVNQGIFNQLTAGSYTITAQDEGGCENNFEIEVEEPTEVVAQAALASLIACYGETATVELSSNRGANYDAFSLNNGLSYDDANTLTLVAGDYSFIARDTNGCVSEPVDLSIDQPDLLELSVTTLPEINGMDGRIIANAGGGTPPYRYSVDGGAFTQYGMFNELPEGNYSLILEDYSGCTVHGEAQIIGVNSVGGLAPEEVFIYPNPSNGIVYVKTGGKIEVIRVRNLLGQIVLETQNSEIHLQDNSKGVYVFEVHIHGGGKRVERVVVE